MSYQPRERQDDLGLIDAALSAPTADEIVQELWNIARDPDAHSQARVNACRTLLELQGKLGARAFLHVHAHTGRAQSIRALSDDELDAMIVDGGYQLVKQRERLKAVIGKD